MKAMERYVRSLIVAGFRTVFLSLVILPMSAYGQGGAGVRAGASLDPDQFYFGGHLELGPVVEQLWFRPNVEIGIGNDITLVGFNGEFAYWFPLASNDWSVYAGAGPAVNIIRFDTGPAGQSETDAEGGFNILLGLAHDEGFFGELKVGALQSPELKLGIGFTFR
jgi:hypothetical protein